MADKFRVSIDIGGTFTDLVYFKISPSGEKSIHIAKTDTTPSNFEQGIFNLIAKEQIDLSHVDYFCHGSTIIINALTEKKGAKTALITTHGFKDVLEIARGNRPDFFNLDYVKPPALVPRYLRKEVIGRMSYQGKELIPLDLSCLPTIIKEFEKEDVESIAVCLLNSYTNPSHEIAVVEEIKKLAPQIQCMGSYQISREWREYERMSTVAFCSYVRPIAQKYLNNLDHKLAEKNYKNALFLMQSNCGVDTLSNSKETPITTVESGPASGMWAVQELSRLLGEKNLIGLDIGGTTAKCSLLKDGHIKINSDYYIDKNEKCAGYPLIIPVVDILEIGFFSPKKTR